MNKGKKTNDFPFTDEELRAAAAKAEEKLMEQYDDLEGYTYTFSEEFEQKMDQFFRKIKRRSQVFEATKRVAAVFAAAVIVAGAWLTFDVNARASVFDWVKSVYEDKIVYLWGGDQESDVLPKYEFSWLPEGFEKVDGTYEDTRTSTCYLNNKTGETVILEYRFFDDLSYEQLYESVSCTDCEHVFIHDIEGSFYCTNKSSNANTLIWVNQEDQIFFKIDSTLEKSTILTIAESITLREGR